MATSTMTRTVRTMMIARRGTTVPMVKAIGRGVAKTKAPPPPSLGDGILGGDVMGNGVSLFIVVVETWVAMGVASGVGPEQEYIAVMGKCSLLLYRAILC